MNRKIVTSFLLLFLVGVNSCLLWGESSANRLEEIVEEAILNNPEIKASQREWDAASEKIVQASTLPDPMASYGYFPENVETRVGPQEAKYGLSQKIPFPGKLNLKGKVQASYADMLKEKYEATKRRVIKDVKSVYYDIFWVDKATQVNEEEKTILESLEKVVQRKYELNLVPQQDVLKVQVELSQIIDRLFVLKQNRKSLQSKMNSLLNRKKGEDFGTIDNLELNEFKYNLGELRKMAQETSQQLQVAKLDIERSEYEKSLARLDYFPDFTLGFEYIQIGNGHTALDNDGQDAWMGMVAVNVPIWRSKLAAQIKEKGAGLEASRKNYENVENNIVFEIEDLYFKINTYQDIISLYKTALMPQTEQSFQTAKIAYETDKSDFLNWLEAERALLQTKLAYYKAIVDYQKSIAYLEEVLGKDL
jgi:cobalt-zinc-cadmium efflux system outer membrane protein